jgi:hypothetical protein
MEHSTDKSFKSSVKAIALLGSVGGINLLLAIGSHVDKIKEFIANPWFPGVWYSIHFLVILFLFILTYNAPVQESKKKYPEPSKAVGDFYIFLLALWIVWIILYGALAIRAFDAREKRITLRKAAHDVQDGLKEINTTEYIQSLLSKKAYPEHSQSLLDNRTYINDALTLAINHPSQGAGQDFWPALKQFQDTNNKLKSKSWELFLNCINNAQAAMFLLLFWVLAYPRKKEQTLMIILVVVVGTFIFLLIDSIFFTDYMGLLGGIFGGVAMALWVGRLDSKFLMTHFIAISSLYFYAILQSTWLVFPDDDGRLLVVTSFAMVLKVVIYLVCSSLLSSGRLLYFFQELRLLSGEKGAEEGPMVDLLTVEDRWKAFRDDLDREKLLDDGS